MLLKKILRISAICLAALIFIIYIVMPAGFGICATMRYSRTVGIPPAGFTDIINDI